MLARLRPRQRAGVLIDEGSELGASWCRSTASPAPASATSSRTRASRWTSTATAAAETSLCSPAARRWIRTLRRRTRPGWTGTPARSSRSGWWPLPVPPASASRCGSGSRVSTGAKTKPPCPARRGVPGTAEVSGVSREDQ